MPDSKPHPSSREARAARRKAEADLYRREMHLDRAAQTAILVGLVRREDAYDAVFKLLEGRLSFDEIDAVLSQCARLFNLGGQVEGARSRRRARADNRHARWDEQERRRFEARQAYAAKRAKKQSTQRAAKEEAEARAARGGWSR